MSEPMFLLTKEEWEALYNNLPGKTTCGQYQDAISQATLKKVAAWIQHNTVKPSGSLPFRFTCWGAEEWAALMREAGLPQVEG